MASSMIASSITRAWAKDTAPPASARPVARTRSARPTAVRASTLASPGAIRCSARSQAGSERNPRRFDSSRVCASASRAQSTASACARSANAASTSAASASSVSCHNGWSYTVSTAARAAPITDAAGPAAALGSGASAVRKDPTGPATSVLDMGQTLSRGSDSPAPDNGAEVTFP